MFVYDEKDKTITAVKYLNLKKIQEKKMSRIITNIGLIGFPLACIVSIIINGVFALPYIPIVALNWLFLFFVCRPLDEIFEEERKNDNSST